MVINTKTSLPARAQLDTLDDIITIFRGYFMLLMDALSFLIQFREFFGMRSR